MKLKQVVLGIALNLVLVSTATYADIMFQSKRSGQNLCDNVAGIWTGQALVSGKVLGIKFSCQYQGTAVVTATGPYSYNLDVDMRKTSGVCPNDKVSIPGSCDPATGAIVLTSPSADLSGAIEADGKSANLKGTVTMSVMGKSITANVEHMGLQKQ